jgi:hypothetical protein
LKQFILLWACARSNAACIDSSVSKRQNRFHDAKSLEKWDCVNPAVYDSVGLDNAGKFAAEVNVESHFFLSLPVGLVVGFDLLGSDFN